MLPVHGHWLVNENLSSALVGTGGHFEGRLPFKEAPLSILCFWQDLRLRYAPLIPSTPKEHRPASLARTWRPRGWKLKG